MIVACALQNSADIITTDGEMPKLGVKTEWWAIAKRINYNSLQRFRLESNIAKVNPLAEGQ
jgi:hypothetical protein